MKKSIVAPISDTIHELKTWPKQFQAIKHGFKSFEVRRNDRYYQVNDFLRLKEWDPTTKKYTGDSIEKRVGYILEGGMFGVESGFIVMGLKEIGRTLTDVKIKQLI